MRTVLKQAMLTGVSIAFFAFSGAALTSSSTQAGPLSVAPKQSIALNSLTETVQYRRGARASRVGPGRRVVRQRVTRPRVVRHRAVRSARVYRGPRYVHRRGHSAAFVPGAVLGLFAGALGAATFGQAYSCGPYHYSWTHCPGYYPSYYPNYYPIYYGGYYPAYRTRRVVYNRPPIVYRAGVHRPRTVRYRAVAPRRHLVGARTHVRSGYRVQRVRR